MIYETYNDSVNRYNVSVNRYNVSVNRYNVSVNRYNVSVNRYNVSVNRYNVSAQLIQRLFFINRYNDSQTVIMVQAENSFFSCFKRSILKRITSLTDFI
jgi:hypothetical protein